MKNKVLAIFLSILFVCMGTFSFAQESSNANAKVQVKFNKEILKLTKAPIITEDTVLVDAQEVVKALGGTYKLENDQMTITTSYATLVVNTKTSDAKLTINGKTEDLKVIIKNENSTMMIGYDYIAEVFGFLADYDIMNNTVVVVDLSVFEKQLKEKAPVYYSMFEKAKTQTMRTDSVMNLDIKAKIDAKELNINGDILAKMIAYVKTDVNEGKMQFKLNVDGSAIPAEVKGFLKELQLDMIYKNESMYMKSSMASLMNPEFSGKWIKTDMQVPMDYTNVDLTRLLTNVLESMPLEKDTFEQMQTFADAFIPLFSNDHFKVEDQGQNKKLYTYTLNANEIKTIVKSFIPKETSKEELAEIEKVFAGIQGTMVIKMNEENNKIVKQDFDINFKVDIKGDSPFKADVVIKGTGDIKYPTEKLNVQEPKSEEVIDMTNLEEIDDEVQE